MTARAAICHWNGLSAILSGMMSRVDVYLRTSKTKDADNLKQYRNTCLSFIHNRFNNSHFDDK